LAIFPQFYSTQSWKKIRTQDSYNSIELLFSDYLERWSRMENYNQITLNYIIIRKHLKIEKSTNNASIAERSLL